MIDFSPDATELLFWNTLALIAAACLFAPLFKRFKLGAILGYLAAGVVVKIFFASSFAKHPEELLHFSEFGVVLFLFVIGLELKPSRLWQMRGDIFGLGLAQMLSCGAVLSVAALFFGFNLATAIIIGLGLALSSTAIVMRQLEERGERSSTHGLKAFSILLFQDLAIVPLLLLVALLAPSGESVHFSQALFHLGLALAAIAGLVLAGRYVLDPLFRVLARAGMQEIMTASALGVVIAAALLMDLVGMSYAMGSFIAGVMLAESDYRHEVEADIEPFRGLFLALFFMAVGLSLDLPTVLKNGWFILLVAPAAMSLKILTVYLLARFFKLNAKCSTRLGLTLAQHGEFGFVLFAAASSAGLIDTSTASILVAVVSVSMALSPLFFALEKFLVKKPSPETIEEDYSDARGCCLIIGFGRFGQVLSQPLFARGIDVTILDHDPERIREAKRFGFRVHYGDGTRRDVLRAARADRVSVIVVCTDDPQVTDKIVALIKANFSQAKVYVRSYDRVHSIRLSKTEIDYSIRETFESALLLSFHTLKGLGVSEQEASHILEDIRRRDLERLQEQIKGNLRSGLDRLHVKPVQPEPLTDSTTKT